MITRGFEVKACAGRAAAVRSALWRKAISRAVLLVIATAVAHAGGPRWVAGSSYFDPAAKGTPVTWKGGLVRYYTDLGDLSAMVNQAQASAMVATAAAVWSGVPTAAVSITSGGSLAEDVNGTNVFDTSNGTAIPTVTLPADIESTATSWPVAVVYDYDGAVIDAIFGDGASDPLTCNQNSAFTIVDNLATDGAIAHAVVILNGLCAADVMHVEMMQYMLVRAFGRVLGLDWSQANESMFVHAAPTATGLTGWPVMHPIEMVCTAKTGPCMPSDMTLRADDEAALSRLYPVTPANEVAFPGKSITAQATISIQGTVHFKQGQGMQGVNVVARPLTPLTGIPDVRYTATAVTGSLFQGVGPNAVLGTTDADGNMRNMYGSDDPALEGWFDLTGIPLPPGETQADYQITFEPINALYTFKESVGPYGLGQVTPSGTLPVLVLRGLTAGAAQQEDVVIGDSADDCNTGNDGTEALPASVPRNGEWMGRICGYGHAGWFQFFARANRKFTFEALALDESGQLSEDKAQPLLGIWNSYDAPGTIAPFGTTQPFNGQQLGLSAARGQTNGDEQLRLGVADARGDGRPDYWYRGRLLYADTVTPRRVSQAGAAITITGMGFRGNSQVLVNGVAAQVTSISPTAITAIVPAAGAGVAGSVDLTVRDPATLGASSLLGGLSYDAADDDALGLAAAPPPLAPMGVPQAFTVRALAPDAITPAGGVTVTFTVTIGTVLLGCGQTTCTAVTGGDGTATVMVTPNSIAMAAVTGALNNGSTIKVEFTGTTPPRISPLTPVLYLAIGATYAWSPQAMVLSGTNASPGQDVTWVGSAGATLTSAPKVVSDSQGTVSATLIAGPLSANGVATVNACLDGWTIGSAGWAVFTVTGVHTETSALVAISGVGQTLSDSDRPLPVYLRVTDAIGHPMAGATVFFYETLRLWEPKCSPHGRCASAPVLGTETVESVSGADGLVTLTPLTEAGLATRLEVLAITGSVASINFEIETHP
jgi:IPT/TIG domain